MKISVDGEELFEISEIQKKVIKNDIQEGIFEEDMKRRLKWVIEEKYKNCFKRLKDSWEPILISKGAKSLPTDPDEFAKLVFSDPDYKNRSERDSEE